MILRVFGRRADIFEITIHPWQRDILNGGGRRNKKRCEYTKDQEDWVRFHLWPGGEREDTELVWIRFTNRGSAYKNGRDNGCTGPSVCVCSEWSRVRQRFWSTPVAILRRREISIRPNLRRVREEWIKTVSEIQIERQSFTYKNFRLFGLPTIACFG